MHDTVVDPRTHYNRCFVMTKVEVNTRLPAQSKLVVGSESWPAGVQAKRVDHFDTE